MNNNYQYVAFGKRIKSEIELPWLLAADRRSVPQDQPLVTVSRERLPRQSGELPSAYTSVYRDTSVGYEVFTSDQRCIWLAENVGTIRICGGREIEVSPAPGSSAESLQKFILGPGLRTICVQRGQLVLHASAVEIGSTTVAFTGPSGHGKSTTAAACYARGHTVLADDITAVDIRNDRALVHPGYPALRVAPGMAKELGLETDSKAGDGWDSRETVDVSNRFATEPRPIQIVYVLTPGDRLVIEEPPPTKRVFALLEASLALYQDSDESALENHLRDCGTVGSSVSVRRLVRPRSQSRVDELCRFIERDIAKSEQA